MVVCRCLLSTQELGTRDYELGVRVCCYTERLCLKTKQKRKGEGKVKKLAETASLAAMFPRRRGN